MQAVADTRQIKATKIHSDEAIHKIIARLNDPKNQKKNRTARSKVRDGYNFTKIVALIAMALGATGTLGVLWNQSLNDPLAWATFETTLIFAAICLLIVSIRPAG